MAKRSAATNADVQRLGPDLATTKAGMDPRRWAAIVKYAHRNGYTVGGALSGAPDALKPRLQSSLAAEARRTVDTAYQPAQSAIAGEGARLTAIAERRRTDESAFNTWAQSQRDKLMAQATAADAATASAQRDLVNSVATRYAAATQSLQDQAQQQPGRVSATNGPNFDLSAPEAAATGNAGAEAAYANTAGASQQGRLAFLMANSIAAAKAGDQGREAASQDQQLKLSQARTDLTQKKAGDYLTTLGDLKKTEQDKASTFGDQQMAADKLGLDSFKAHQDALLAQQDYGLKTKQFNLDQWKATHADAVAQAKIQMGYSGIAQRHGDAVAARELKKWLAHNSNRQKALDRASGTAKPANTGEYKAVPTILSEINRLHKKGVRGTPLKDLLVKRGASGPEIDVASDVAANNGKLSPRGRRKAAALGMTTAQLKALGWI